MSMPFSALLVVPLLAPALFGAAAVALPDRRVAAWSGVASSAVALVVALVLLAHRGWSPTWHGGLLRADPLSAFMLLVIGAVGLTATWGGLDRGRLGGSPRGPSDGTPPW